jgi:G2/mitotic-specific cyclin 1/2
LQDDTITHYAGYTEDEIEPVFQLMIDYLARPVVHEAFFKKYASKKFLKGICPLHLPPFTIITRAKVIVASILTRQWARKNAYLFGITDTDQPLDQI